MLINNAQKLPFGGSVPAAAHHQQLDIYQERTKEKSNNEAEMTKRNNWFLQVRSDIKH